MRFSLILATINRTEELARFLTSLGRQTHQDIQLIVIDQNSDDRLVPLLAAVDAGISVLHLRAAPGLSRARNAGLPYVDGDIVTFPDDDCWYDAGLLERISALLASHPHWDGVSGRSIDAEGRTSSGDFAAKSGPVRMLDVWIKATSFTIFLRRPICDRIGSFDEELGVGAGTPFGSAEDTDYMIRAIKAGAQIEYKPDLTVFHPNKVQNLDEASFSRARSYGAGMGRVLHRQGYPTWFKLRSIIRPLLGAMVALVRLNPRLCRFRWNTAVGRLDGLRSS